MDVFRKNIELLSGDDVKLVSLSNKVMGKCVLFLIIKNPSNLHFMDEMTNIMVT